MIAGAVPSPTSAPFTDPDKFNTINLDANKKTKPKYSTLLALLVLLIIPIVIGVLVCVNYHKLKYRITVKN